MVERRGHEIDLPLAKSPEFRKHVEDRQRLPRRLIGQRPQDALRVTGRARGVKHRPAERLVGNGRRGKFGRRLIEVVDARSVARTVDNKTKLDLRTFAQRLERDCASGLRGNEHLGQAVVDDVGELARGQERIDVGPIEPGPLAGDVALDEAGVVFHEYGIVVAPLEPDRAQEMGEPVAARIQFPVGDRLARSRHDDRRLIGARLSVRPWIHALPPKARLDPRRFAPRPRRARKSRLPQDLRLVETRARALSGRARRSGLRGPKLIWSSLTAHAPPTIPWARRRRSIRRDGEHAAGSPRSRREPELWAQIRPRS